MVNAALIEVGEWDRQDLVGSAGTTGLCHRQLGRHGARRGRWQCDRPVERR
jgi:hypothetical protein